MGTTSSSNDLPSSPIKRPAPLSEIKENTPSTLSYTPGECIRPELVNENSDRADSEGTGSYASLRRDGWDQRPPNLLNFGNSRQDTLLTYATQMTGWQSACGQGPPLAQHHEVMELSRIISQLAMANQQLATAHNATLARLEALYLEHRREKGAGKTDVPLASVDSNFDEALCKRLSDDDVRHEEEQTEMRKLERRMSRLENSVTENIIIGPNRQRISRRDNDKVLRSRIERLECLLNAHGTYTLEENDEDKKSLVEGGRNCQSEVPIPGTEILALDDRKLNRINVPDNLVKAEAPTIQMETSVGCRKNAIHRISRIQTDVEAGASRIEEKHCPCSCLHLEEGERKQSTINSVSRYALERVEREVMSRLSEEMEILKSDRLEYQITNERLLNSLADQQKVIDKLSEDYQLSKARYERLEHDMNTHRQQYDQLTVDFESAKKETERLLKEISAFHLEKDTAEAKVLVLEQDLRKALLEKEHIKDEESQKSLKLKAQLSDEVLDKKKQMKALEDALKEIQRLKETVKTEMYSNDDDSQRDDVDPLEPIDEVTESSQSDRVTNMEEFKKELTLKREARQRAIAAVSSEMERLRRELDAEKEAHSETSRVLDLLKTAQAASQDEATPNARTATAGGEYRISKLKERKPDENEIALRQLEARRLTSILKVSDELRNHIRYQIEKVDDLRYHLETEPEHHRHRIRCLTDITNVTREALCARERRTNELKDHLAQVLARLGNRGFLDEKDDIGAECDRQLENVNTLKNLYNERLRVSAELKEAVVKELVNVKDRLEHSLKKSECLEEDLRKADEKVDVQDTEISNLESQLGLAKADCRDLQNQMSLINGLFTQMLLGASSADMDLDRLTRLLQENHDLICDMAREEGTEAAALPKLLLDLVEQVEGGKSAQKCADGEDVADDGNEVEKKEDDLHQEDIAHNLPKVWRVLLELLSCHAVGTSNSSVASSSDPNSCYKSVDTPAGPRLVISVSKTYIRLKELILEKKHLEKEMNRMKQLNSHLESKLGEQEKRLSMVSDELSKTWNIVGRMQAQHQQLHTHEKILRYELQQKRKMLQELKQELEYCREKWESARQKNTNTELEWRSLRREFAARKALAVQDSFNNSAESGFSDGRGDDSDEEDGTVEGRIRLGPRRRARKESPRTPSPDTESEQPTDTELSESKTSSSVTLEQRTPTPETEAELEETEIADTDLNLRSGGEIESELVSENMQESLDPLDQALTNVIKNLIRIDDDPSFSNDCSSKEEATPAPEEPLDNILSTDVDNNSNCQTSEKVMCDQDWSRVSADASVSYENDEASCQADTTSNETTVERDLALSTIAERSSELDTFGERTFAPTVEPLSTSASHSPAITSASAACTMSVFSIGPFPASSVTTSSMKSVQFSSPLIVGPSNSLLSPVFGIPTSDPAMPTRENASLCSSFASSLPANEDAESKSLAEKKSFKSMESVLDSDSVSVDSSSSLETVKEFPVASSSSTSSIRQIEDSKKNLDIVPSSIEQKDCKVLSTRTPEEALAARADRLKRLEEQADWLMKKMNATSKRGSALSTRLEELHEAYGEPPVPPPMPDVLPSQRLATILPESSRQSNKTSAKNEDSDKSSSSNNTP